MSSKSIHETTDYQLTIGKPELKQGLADTIAVYKIHNRVHGILEAETTVLPEALDMVSKLQEGLDMMSKAKDEVVQEFNPTIMLN